MSLPVIPVGDIVREGLLNQTADRHTGRIAESTLVIPMWAVLVGFQHDLASGYTNTP